MIDVSTAKSITLNGSDVSKITEGGVVLWEKGTPIDYLCFTDASGSSNTLTLTKNGSSAPTVTLEYSTDKVHWTTWTQSNNVRTYTIPANGSVYLRGINPNGFGYDYTNYHAFSSTKNINASGNLMTIIDSVGETNTISTYCFGRLFLNMTTLLLAPSLTISSVSGANACYQMFYGCSSLTSASNITLNATTIPSYSYSEMFNMCSALDAPPTITSSALTIGSHGLAFMFRKCTSLTTAPNLNIATLDSSGTYHCDKLFYGCSALTDVTKVKLNANALYTGSYRDMFNGCALIVNAPEIKATSISGSDGTYGALANMFHNCSSLNYIRVHFTSWNSGAYTQNWTYGTKSTGTFYKPSSLPSTKNASGNTTDPHYIPYNWTVSNI